MDLESGCHYYGHRYYSAELGRWLNRDPLGEEDGPCLYQYVRNNPLNNMDLNGLKTIYFVAGFDSSFNQSNPALLRKLEGELKHFIDLCEKMASPHRSFWDRLFGRNKSPTAQCPRLDASVFRALGVEIEDGGLVCGSPSNKTDWDYNWGTPDFILISQILDKLRKNAKNKAETGLVMTNWPFMGDKKAAARSAWNGNDYFVIRDLDYSQFKYPGSAFPHELGHRVGWLNPKALGKDPKVHLLQVHEMHADDGTDHLMGKAGGKSVDCQWCELLLKFAR